MSVINFIFNNCKTTILCKENENLEEIINKFCTKTNVDANSKYFIYGGKTNLNKKLTFSELANTDDKLRNQMDILVNELDIEEDNPSIIKSKEIICPKCGELSEFKIDEYKISIKCKKGHKIDNLFFNEFEKTQYLDMSKIICQQCKIKNRAESYNNMFYICNTCKLNLCPLCQSNHDKTHNIINYDSKNYICSLHTDYYNSYCRDCKKDICRLCEKAHLNHDTSVLGNRIISTSDLKKKVENLKNKIDEFKKEVNKIINSLNKTMEYFDFYYKLVDSIFSNYNEKKINYSVINNLEQITYNNNILKDINEIIESDSEIVKCRKILEIYELISKKEKNSITLIYKPNGKNKIRIFGGIFVENNIDICKLSVEGNEYKLMEEFNIQNLNLKDDNLVIKLRGINKVKDMSYMFHNCTTLLSSPDISNWDTSNITDMSSLFCGFNSLIPPDISKWNTKNVTSLSHMFYKSPLTIMPDMSKWDTSNVKNMKAMFSECEYICELPNISNWNTSKVIDMSDMFKCCLSLESLPDISKWDTSNVKNMSYMFYKCKSLKSLPDISKWNIQEVNDKTDMFDKCNSSLKIPDKFKKKFLELFGIKI